MGLWRDMCPFLFWGAEWLVSILPSAAAVVRCLPCCAPLAGLCGVSAKGGKGGEDANSHAVQGTLCVRTHAPHGAYPETPGNTHFHLSKWTNCIRTTEYTWWNFLPKNLWSQISQPANFYFLVMALMQMVPQISDSDGLPTFLFPLSLVMLITAAKDAYENIKRARADQEENDRVCRLIPAGGEDAGIEMVRWRQLRPGDIVKLHCDEPVPADMMMLNCADEYGVAYLETVQLDGETNLKHKMCIPEIAEIVRSDQQASVLALEVSYEPPSAELYKFSGTVTVNPSDALMTGRHSALGWGRASLPHLHMSSQRTSPLVTPPAATPRHLTTPSIGGTPLSAAPGRSRLHSQSDVHSGVEECRAEGGGRGVGGLSVRQESNPGRTARSSDALLALPGTGAKHERGGGLLSRESSTSQARNVQRKSRPGGGGGQGRGSVPSPAPTQFGVDISQFLWRGATLRNTAWAYGVVLYTGAHTRIMKNTRSRELKYSRLQVYYNQHALLLAIAQFVLCLVSAVAFASYNQRMSDTAWYLESSWESGVGNFFVSLGIAFGQYVLLLSYFVPITLLVQLEVCRACQAGFLSADDHMLCPATEKKASVQSVALMEELGSVTHVFSDKTGTLTQNLMQFRCLAVGDTLHGFDEYQEMKSFVSHSSLVSSPAPDRPGSGSLSFFSPDAFKHYGRGADARADAGQEGGDAVAPNKYVCFNAKLFAQRMRRAPLVTQQKAADLLMVMALCHSVLPKQDAQLPPTGPLGAQRMPAPDNADDISGHSSSIPASPSERPSPSASPVFSTTNIVPPNRDSLFAPPDDLPAPPVSQYSPVAALSEQSDRGGGVPLLQHGLTQTEDGRAPAVEHYSRLTTGTNKSLRDRSRAPSERSLAGGPSDHEEVTIKCRGSSFPGPPDLKASRSFEDCMRPEDSRGLAQGSINSTGRGFQGGDEKCGQAGRVEDYGCGKDTGLLTGMTRGGTRVLDTSADHRRSPFFSGSASPVLSPSPSEAVGWTFQKEKGEDGKEDGEESMHGVSCSAPVSPLSRHGTERVKASPGGHGVSGWGWNFLGQEEERTRRDMRFSRAAHHSAGLWDFKWKQQTQGPPVLRSRDGEWEVVGEESSDERSLSASSSSSSSSVTEDWSLENEEEEVPEGRCACCGRDMVRGGKADEFFFSAPASSLSKAEAGAGASLQSLGSQPAHPALLSADSSPHSLHSSASPSASAGAFLSSSNLPESFPFSCSPSATGAGTGRAHAPVQTLSRCAAQRPIALSACFPDQHDSTSDDLFFLSRPPSARCIASDGVQQEDCFFPTSVRPVSRPEPAPRRGSRCRSEDVFPTGSFSLNDRQDSCQLTRLREPAYVSVAAHRASVQGGTEHAPRTADDLSSVPVAPSPSASPSLSSPQPSQRSGASPVVQARLSPAPADARGSSPQVHLHRSHQGGLLAVQLAALRLTPEAEYDASSPDELALTAAAKHLGAEFVCRPSLSTIQLALTTSYAEDCLLSAADKAHLARLRQSAQDNESGADRGAEEKHLDSGEDDEDPSAKNGEQFLRTEDTKQEERPESLVPVVVFDVLEVLEFDNFRKRMSVVIRDREGRLRLLVKGADSSVLDIAARGQEKLKRDLTDQLSEMASQGLRTLVMGQRYLTEKQFQKYRAMLLAAKGETGERKEEALSAVLSRIEKNIELLGASGIDDKLQDQVAETISDIKQAGVKLWVLTGDKMETAIAIGHSCSILSDATYNAIVDGTSPEAVREQLHQYMSYIVAAQLASEAFEQIALRSLESRPSEVSDVSEALVRGRSTSGAAYSRPQVKQGGRRGHKGAAGAGGSGGAGRCVSCLAGAVKHRARCGGGKTEEDGESDSVRARQARQAPPSMPWEEFVKILTFNAKRKVVKADPKQRRHKRLSPAQVEEIVQEYLEHFDKSSEENAKDKTKRTRSSRSRGTAKPTSAPTSSVSQGGASRAGTSGARGRPRKLSSSEMSRDNKDDQAVPFIPSREKSTEQSDGKSVLGCGVLPPVLEQGASPESHSDNRPSLEDVGSNKLDHDQVHATESKSLSRQVQPAAEHGAARTDSARPSIADLHSKSSLGNGGVFGSNVGAPSLKKDQESGVGRDGSIKGKKPKSLETAVMTEAAVEGYEACAITITGEALTHALSTAENRRYFFGLANLCSTVIACRVSPKQKSEVVTQCKRYQSGTVSLGIGDGANDVGMLVAANVGVGIQGKEGLQAVRAADFAIGEFKFVRNLMFCHGREALRRNAFQMYQTIFKNVVFGLADFFFAFLSVFAATDLFNPWLKQLYNVLYTCIPVVLFTVFDRQLPYDVLFQTPVLYPAFSKLGVNMFAGSRTFWKWFIFGFYASAALVYFPVYGMGWAFTYTNSEGVVTFPLAYEGSVVFWSIIVACNLVMVPFMHTWFWFIWLGIFVNFAFWILSLVICPRLPADFCTDLCGALEATHQNVRYYFSFLLAVFIALLPQYLIWFIKVTFRPSAPCVIRERIAKGVFDVVIAPRGGQKMVVVVPKKVSNEWRGFAFAEQDRTRWGQHRRSMRALLDEQSSSFLALAGSCVVPTDPPLGPPPSLRFNPVDGSCSSESTDTRLSRSFSKGASKRLSKEDTGS